MSLEYEELGGDNFATPVSFKTKIEALTGVTISSDPTEDQASIYLRDGVLEITNRMKELAPEDTFQFTKAYITSSNTEINKFDVGRVVNVVRESGTSNDWRACRFISPDLKSRVTDKSSIHYASAFNPVYTLDNKVIEIFPVPNRLSTTGNRGKVYAVNQFPENSEGRQLTVLHDDIGWFPQNKVFLVLLYASIKVLDKLVSAAHSMPSALSSITLRTPVLPAVPTLSSNSLSFSQSAPTYETPVLALDAAPSISDLSISALPPVPPSISDNSISFTTTAPTYVQPAVAPDFSDANTWLNTEEDSEMVASRMQVIGGQIQEYQQNMQNNLNTFNKENAEYQAELQRSIQNAQLSAGDDNQAIQKYQAELSVYTANVNKEVQEYTQNFQKELQLWQINRTTSTQKYSADLQNNLNLFNKENAQYQIEFQKAVQNAQLSSKDEDQTIQKYQAELSAYSAEVNREVQEVSKLSAETQKYSAEVQKVKMDIDLYHQRSMKLQQQYDAAFQFMVSPDRAQKAQQKRRQ